MPTPVVVYNGSSKVSQSNPLPVLVTGGDISFGDITFGAGLATEIKQDSQILSLANLVTSSAGTLTSAQAIATAIAAINGKTPALGQALAAGSVPVVLTAAQLAAISSETTVAALLTTLNTLNGKTPGLGQALAAASVPVVLPTSQLSLIATEATLASVLAAIATSNTALGTNTTALGTLNTTATDQSATLDAIDSKTPALGQALAASSVPVVLPTTQISVLATDANINSKIGSLTETAPANDTASAGLNGRLQRIAQNITSLIAKLPTALTAAGNLKAAILEALPAGTNNIGDVDVLTLPDVRESWRTSTLSFTSANSSNTTFTVPANTEYQILSVYVSFTSDATAGNRLLSLLGIDGSGNTIATIRAGVTQAASLTRIYMFAPGMVQDTVFRDTDYASVSMMPLFLTAGQVLRVYDRAAIAAATDDMIVRVQIASRSIA